MRGRSSAPTQMMIVPTEKAKSGTSTMNAKSEMKKPGNTYAESWPTRSVIRRRAANRPTGR